MKIAIDLDATITAYPEVFSSFSKAFSLAGHEIHIVTDRVPGSEEEVMRHLYQCRITYDAIKITADKAAYILSQNIDVLFDDTDEYFIDLPESVAVFKVREHYNFDFKHKKWLYTKNTGRKL